MLRPRTKDELIQQSHEGFHVIMDMIDQLPVKERVKTYHTKERDKNLRDILFHLYAWHCLLIKWFQIDKEGGHPVLPEVGYSWDNLEELNQEFWLEAQHHPLMDTLELLENSHQKCMNLIESMSEASIITPHHFRFSNSPVMGLLDGCMADHYHWAIDQIRLHHPLHGE